MPTNGVRSSGYGSSLYAPTAAIGRQRKGFTPPVKRYGNGHTTPASVPSKVTWISRNAPPPHKPFALAYASGSLPYQNSSHEFPFANSSSRTCDAFVGKVTGAAATAARPGSKIQSPDRPMTASGYFPAGQPGPVV